MNNIAEANDILNRVANDPKTVMVDITETELSIIRDAIAELNAELNAYKFAASLEARIEELEAALDKAAHQLYDYSGSCPSDLYDWEHPNTCIRECAKYEKPDEAWKCWRLWLMCPAPQEEK